MPSFITVLEERVGTADSLVCVGLDPHPASLPAPTAAAAREFCLNLIEATAERAAAFKPNSAFFELFGPEGIEALRTVIAAVPVGIPVILDAKRGDIASTAKAYAQAAFETLGADAVTANPLLGRDSIEPFLSDPRRGVFILCKTSNPGAAEFQDLEVSGGGEEKREFLYQYIARLAASWNVNDNLGLVVGATHPRSLATVRAAAPHLWFLCPGVGAQGADLETALAVGLREDGMGLLVNASRSIAQAEDPAHAVTQLQEAINRRRERPKGEFGSTQSLQNPVEDALPEKLLEAGCIKFGNFTLKSGMDSPFYIDLRRLASDPTLLADVARAYVRLLRRLPFDRVAALPYAAMPIGTAVSLQGGWPMLYPRKEVKEYGTAAAIEGHYCAGERIVVLDDLTTTGASKFEAIDKLMAAGLQVRDVVVLIDRQSGAREAMAEAGYRLHAVYTLTELLDRWERLRTLSREDLERARRFLVERG